ncbi:MAG: DedA family protein [Coriobacteriia bacterium]|nr:DedA family protein [Coriobacteriia bacterium]
MAPITGVPLIDWFLALLDTWGYLLVTLFTVLENLFVIGSFTPGETIVMAAAFLTTPQHGHLWLPFVWTASVVGTTIGSNLSYWFGRRGGRDALVRYGRRFRVTEERVAEAEAYFFIHGSKTVFLARFAAGFKNFVPVIAGVSRMPLLYFQGWTLLGAVTYTSLMCAIGVLVGENFDRALNIARGFGVFGLLLFIGVIALVLFGRRRYVVHKREEVLVEYAEEIAGGDDSK